MAVLVGKSEFLFCANILKKKHVDFKFDGDMQPDVALSNEYSDLYPFSEIVGNANILIMPGQHSAAISVSYTHLTLPTKA